MSSGRRLCSRMASADGSVWTPPVDPETTDTPSTVNSLLTVRLPLMESWLALMLVAVAGVYLATRPDPEVPPIVAPVLALPTAGIFRIATRIVRIG